MSNENRRKAVEILNLHYSYKSDWTAKRFHAVKGISLDVFEGESFGFLGHNGAGKTTTIKCLLGLIRPTAGQLKIFGTDSRETDSRAAVGYLPEQPYFYDHLTVREIMQMYAQLAGVPSSQRNAAISNALDKVKVSARAKSPMRALSKGLTQRVAMAQAIVALPRLLVLDEPFSGLDPIGRREFKDILVALKKEGTTIFMSSHILSDVEFLCDRASIMAHGEIKSVFELQNLSNLVGGHYELVVARAGDFIEKLRPLCTSLEESPRSIRCTFLEQSDAERALRMTLESSAKVESYEFVQGSLEELFLKLVQFEEGKR
ncbi:MAG: ABC transporter ATP-binding protein [Deltaproteobacteria bacterium]|nr:ABC transporter ATP-binding protein [Deltaproteobacteria bacterium]